MYTMYFLKEESILDEHVPCTPTHFYIRTRESPNNITGYNRLSYRQNLSSQEANPLFPRAQRPSNPVREFLTGVD
jgi:hypothetical protein